MRVLKRRVSLTVMRKIFLINAITFVGLLIVVACASTQPVQKSNLTYGTVKKNIVKGKTSQAEVVQLLGSPNIVSKNTKGEEVWTYSRQSYDAESGGFGGGVILFGGSKAFSSSSSATFDLILTFNQQEIVEDYKVVSSQF